MGVGGVSGGSKSSGGGSVSGGKGNSSVGAKNSGNCSTSVKSNSSAKTTTATKSCGIQGFHGAKGIDTSKYAADKLSKALDAKNKAASATNVKTASVGKNYNVQNGIKTTSKVEAKMAELGKKVVDKTGHKITFSSGYRNPASQAKAMYNNAAKYGVKDFNKYTQKSLAKEIKSAYLSNSKDKNAAIDAMTKVIENQVAAGKYVSSHLRSNAVDVSSADRKYYNEIREAVKEMGGTSLTEKDHLHIQF
jgi:hypothetical protein